MTDNPIPNPPKTGQMTLTAQSRAGVAAWLNDGVPGLMRSGDTRRRRAWYYESNGADELYIETSPYPSHDRDPVVVARSGDIIYETPDGIRLQPKPDRP